MLKKIALVGTAGFIAFLMSGITFADMSQSSGVYAEGNLGWGRVAEEPAGSTKTENTGVGLNMSIGYKFNPTIAVEAGVYRYPTEDFGNSEGSSNYAGIAAIKGAIPFDNGFEAFAKVGGAIVSHNLKGKNGGNPAGAGDYTGGAILLGAGLGYAFTPNWEGTVQGNVLASADDNIPTMQMLTIGLTYFF